MYTQEKNNIIYTQHASQHFKQVIDSIDFSDIINKLIMHNGWRKKDAEKTCELYRNFLFLNIKYSQTFKTLPPSEDIDEFWHQHILDTKKYQQDCKLIFGHFFHHYPYFGIDGKTNFDDLCKMFEITQQLYLLEFKEIIPPTKSKYSAFIYYILKKFETFRFTSSKTHTP